MGPSAGVAQRRRSAWRCAIARVIAGGALLLLPAGRRAAAGAADVEPESAADEHESKIKISKELTDPVSLTWSLKVKNVISFLDIEGHGDPVQYELKFQPTMPVLLTRDLKLITRPEFTLVDDKPYTAHGELQRTTGVGDTILDVVLAPVSDPWLLGLGPTFVFPTANLDQTGKGKWQAGPAGVAGYREKRWIAGLIAQQWWSFAGADRRPAASELHLQYIADWYFGDGWSIGTCPTIKFDWRASPGNQVTFPIGPSVAKVVKVGGRLPVKLEIEGLYVPIHPDPNGEQFVIEIKITPVIPSLLPGPLFGD